MANASYTYEKSVFINCPLDEEYEPLLDALLFTIVYCSFTPRCALEPVSGNRLDRIYQLIENCRLGIHDISRVEVAGKKRMPRFNMPFETGLFLGAKQFGSSRHKGKDYLVLGRTKHDYKEYLSDLAGQDHPGHGNDPKKLIHCVRKWLDSRAKQQKHLPGALHIATELRNWAVWFSALCKEKRRKKSDFSYDQLVESMVTFIKLQERKASKRKI